MPNNREHARLSARDSRQIKTPPVVADLQHDFLGADRKFNFHPRRAGML